MGRAGSRVFTLESTGHLHPLLHFWEGWEGRKTTRQIQRGSAREGSRLQVELGAQRLVDSEGQATMQLSSHGGGW